MDNTNQDVVTLRDYVESRLVAIERSIELAKQVQDARLDSMNHFRAENQRMVNTMMARSEYFAGHERVVEDIRQLRKFADEQTGKASQGSVVFSYGLGLAGLAMAIAAFFHK